MAKTLGFLPDFDLMLRIIPTKKKPNCSYRWASLANVISQIQCLILSGRCLISESPSVKRRASLRKAISWDFSDKNHGNDFGAKTFFITVKESDLSV
jgi:hypothetical protein